jgi:hypothetical protein
VDQAAWEAQLSEAFATRSRPACDAFLGQLAEVCPDYEAEEGWIPDEAALNATLAVVSAERPATPLEACMVSQMAALHQLTVRAVGHALRHNSGGLQYGAAELAPRLTRAFARQADALHDMRRRRAVADEDPGPAPARRTEKRA